MKRLLSNLEGANKIKSKAFKDKTKIVPKQSSDSLSEVVMPSCGLATQIEWADFGAVCQRYYTTKNANWRQDKFKG